MVKINHPRTLNPVKISRYTVLLKIWERAKLWGQRYNYWFTRFDTRNCSNFIFTPDSLTCGCSCICAVGKQQIIGWTLETPWEINRIWTIPVCDWVAESICGRFISNLWDNLWQKSDNFSAHLWRDNGIYTWLPCTNNRQTHSTSIKYTRKLRTRNLLSVCGLLYTHTCI